MGCTSSTLEVQPVQPCEPKRGLPRLLGAKTGLEFQVEGRGSEAKSPEECRSRSNKAFGPSWELELLRVGERLKKKLQDPHFVATRVSESDDLELHQLQQALKVFAVLRSKKTASARNTLLRWCPRMLLARRCIEAWCCKRKRSAKRRAANGFRPFWTFWILIRKNLSEKHACFRLGQSEQKHADHGFLLFLCRSEFSK